MTTTMVAITATTTGTTTMGTIMGIPSGKSVLAGGRIVVVVVVVGALTPGARR
jgi:hypothetical protein